MSTENKYKNMVCLYIFTHNITGLKYFGKTKVYFTIETLLKYGGSGSYWKDHKKVHGNDLSAEIYGIFHKDEVKEIALKFSEDNNIVKSLNESGNRKGKKIWANEKNENGLDGGSDGNMLGKLHSKETKQKMSNSQKGRTFTIETREKMSESAKKRDNNWTGRKHSDESKLKISNSLTGKKQSPETIEKRMKHIRGSNITEEHKRKISEFNKGRTHTEEMKKNLSDKAKNREKIKCPYCNKEATPGLAKRWHFDNCKLKEGNKNIDRSPWNKGLKIK